MAANGVFRKKGVAMLVFWKPKLVFLATPKTGTTAIETALESMAALSILRPPPLKHTSLHRYNRFLRPYLEDAAGGPFTVVAQIREPLDWLGSWYRYRQRDGIGNPNKSTRNISFDEFVQAYCREDRPEFANVGSQARFLRMGDGKWVDKLFRYEDIGTFVHFLEDALNCEILLPRLNVSPQGHLDLSTKTESLLRRHAERDFAMHRTLQPGNA